MLECCGEDVLVAISSNKLPKKLSKGEQLFAEGDLKQGISFIKKGFLKVELNGKVGRPLILRIAGRGAIFGHRITPKHMYYPYTATAVSNVEYCYIPYEQFDKIAENNTALHQQFVTQFLDELEMAEKRALNLSHKSVRGKVADALLLLARAYEYKEGSGGFRTVFCRQEIGDLAGTTKEQVSKVLKDFENEGIVKCTGKHFNYLNLKALQSE